MPNTKTNKPDAIMKADVQANEALAVIEQYATLSAESDQSSWEANQFRAALPSKPVLVVADVIAARLKGHPDSPEKVEQAGARWDNQMDAAQRVFSRMIWDREASKGHVVLDVNPAQLGEPQLSVFSEKGEAGRQLTVFFTMIPETSSLYDDTRCAYWALLGYPDTEEARRLNGRYLRRDEWHRVPDGYTVEWQPSKTRPNILAVVKTFATLDHVLDGTRELRTAVREFTRQNPDYIQMVADEQEAALHPEDTVDFLTGEIIRSRNTVRQSAQPF